MLTPTKNIVNSMQIYETTSADYQFEIDLTYDQNIEQCVPFICNSAKGTDFRYLQRIVTRDDDNDKFNIECYNSDPTTNLGSRDITLYILEFNENITIQKGEVSWSGTDDQTVTISSVDLNRAILHFYSYVVVGTDKFRYLSTRGWLSDSTTITFSTKTYSSPGTTYVSWYVLECTSEDAFWSVEQVRHSEYDVSTSDPSEYYEDISVEDVNRTMILNSFLETADINRPYNCMYKTYYPETDYAFSQIKYMNYNSSDGWWTHAETQVITFSESSGVFVTFGDVTLNSSTTSVDYTVHAGVGIDGDTEFDLTRAMVISANENGWGRVNSSSASASDEGIHHYSFYDSTTVRATRIDSSADSDSFFFAYQFPEYNGYYMEGYVKEISDPVAREVYAFRADTGELIDQTTSDSGTGYFYLETSYSGVHYVVCMDDDAGTDYNDLIYGQIYPTVISGCFAHYMGWTDTSLTVGTPAFRQ